MPFVLGTDTVFAYLKSHHWAGLQGVEPVQIQPKLCKNFNLIVELSNGENRLLKQEPRHSNGQTSGELLNEWHIHQWIDVNPDLHHLKSLISQAIAFDPEHSILILHYRTDYGDLETVYGDRRDYPPDIAHALGATLAELHRSTLDHPATPSLLRNGRRSKSSHRPMEVETVPGLTQTWDHITPETFGQVTEDGLKFYELMQRYGSLKRAIARLSATYHPCCLIHGDLKFSNLLLHHQWQAQIAAQGGTYFDPRGWGDDAPIRVIDWEKWCWGDPAFDLGCLVADYLKHWLKSLMASQDIPIDLALRLATTPLEQVQPSMNRLIQAYLGYFPEIWQRFPDFLPRVMGFAGLALIRSIQTHIHYYEPFGNVGICMLQVAKTLLCSPETSIQTVLGQEVGRGQS